MMDDRRFTVTCCSGHRKSLTIDELEEVLDPNTCPIEGCKSAVVSCDPAEIEVECIDCGWEDRCDWQNVVGGLWGSCPRCSSNTGTSGDIRIVGTHSHAVGEYQNFCDGVPVDEYFRGKREDYWAIVVHYTRRQDFLGIMRDKKIRAAPTGYFKAPAVCMTELPPRFCKDLKSHFGPYGVAFKKDDVIKNAGGPAAYLLDAVIKAQEEACGFDSCLRPFVNVLRIPETAPTQSKAKRVDFVHEREWRVPGDLVFSEVPPIAVILPEGNACEKFYGPDGGELLTIAWKYGEIMT
jgi:hypothetical protein